MWPEYQNETEFYNDFIFTVWASPSNVSNFTNYLATVPVESGHINAQLCIANSQKIKSDYQRKFPPECQGRPSYNSNNLNLGANIQHAFLANNNVQFRQQAQARVFAEQLPYKFEEYVAQELMISIDQANDMIFEYRRWILLLGITKVRLYPSEQIEKVWLIHMAHSNSYLKFCDKTIKYVPYHMPFTGNTNGFDDRAQYVNTLSFYQLIFNEVPCTSVWPPVDFRFQVENFQCMFVNLIRLAGMYWAHSQGNLKGSATLKPRGGADEEQRDKLKAKHKHKEPSRAGDIAVGAGIGAGVVLGVGGLALVANPNVANYNDPDMMDGIVEGFHDGLSALTDISFGAIADVGEGVMGAFEDIDWPDIDFDGFAEAAGDLFGDAGEFFADLGEGIGDGIGDLAEGIGDAFDW